MTHISVLSSLTKPDTAGSQTGWDYVPEGTDIISLSLTGTIDGQPGIITADLGYGPTTEVINDLLTAAAKVFGVKAIIETRLYMNALVMEIHEQVHAEGGCTCEHEPAEPEKPGGEEKASAYL